VQQNSRLGKEQLRPASKPTHTILAKLRSPKNLFRHLLFEVDTVRNPANILDRQIRMKSLNLNPEGIAKKILVWVKNIMSLGCQTHNLKTRL